MARPQKMGLDYFPHDTDSSSDEKIEALMMLYETKGYTFYFVMLERIYRTSNFELDISDAETIQILSRKMSITTEEFQQILKSAIKHKCFDAVKYQNEHVLTSNGIKKRAGVVIDKREKMRISYESRKKDISDAEIREETAQESPQSKGKKIKEDIIIENCPHEEIKGLFNSICTSLPLVKTIGKSRASKVNARWKDMDSNIDTFRELFSMTEASDFLSGRSGQWKCSFDWLMMNDTNYCKVLEGNYDNKPKQEEGIRW